MTGELLYTTWAQFLYAPPMPHKPWESLTENERDAWNKTASTVRAQESVVIRAALRLSHLKACLRCNQETKAVRETVRWAGEESS